MMDLDGGLARDSRAMVDARELTEAMREEADKLRANHSGEDLENELEGLRLAYEDLCAECPTAGGVH